MRNLFSVILLVIGVLVMLAAPASAHMNTAADRVIGPLETPQTASGGVAAVAHTGIQCAVEGNPNTAAHDGNPNLVSLPVLCPALDD